MTQRLIRLATGVVVNPETQRALVVRKHGSQTFIQPGGKIEAGETPLEALCRELNEEIGLIIAPQDAGYIGHFTAPAVHETGFTVASDAFWIETDKQVCAAAEIAEIRWIDPSHTQALMLAPLSRDQLMPVAAKRLGLS